MESTLVRFDKQLILQQTLEHTSDVLDVHLEGRREYHPGTQKQILFIISLSMSLTSSWKTAGALDRPNGKNQIFEGPRGGVKGHLPLIPLNQNTMVSVAQIQLCEESHPLQKLTKAESYGRSMHLEEMHLGTHAKDRP